MVNGESGVVSRECEASKPIQILRRVSARAMCAGPGLAAIMKRCLNLYHLTLQNSLPDIYPVLHKYKSGQNYVPIQKDF